MIGTLFLLLALAGAGCKTEENVPAVPEQTTVLPGDDNRDGTIQEDESGWDCETDGNQVCGPMDRRS
ncbi:hypothetical protein CDG81_09655 [Actinopolyspora erythraea]|uniref:Uncharacterized protein n=1 Tax=Actinopolyspora erythraea TaxID=414996 RepID=A0A223RRN6_9ACTN|nr:hypothetical protein CDG81_09655 [Actinopolyspora erythraea]